LERRKGDEEEGSDVAGSLLGDVGIAGSGIWLDGVGGSEAAGKARNRGVRINT
jgi:hypothetical protein